MTELSHGIIKANIVQFVWPSDSNKPQWTSCDRAHLFKTMASSLHTSNTRIDKAYKELIKKGIIKILKESGFRGSSKHEVRINENDTAIQLLAIQKRIVYFESNGKKQFPNMFKEDFMLNNFAVEKGKFVGIKRKADKKMSKEQGIEDWFQLNLNMPYSINPKYQNDFDAYCFQMNSLYNDVSSLALSMSNGYIAKEYDYMIRNFTITAVNVVMESIQSRISVHGDHKLTPKSDNNFRKRWELLIRFRTNLTWLNKVENSDKKFHNYLYFGQKFSKFKDGPALELSPQEKEYLKKYPNYLRNS